MLDSLSVCNVKGRFKVQVLQDLLFRRLIRARAYKVVCNFSFLTLHGLTYSVFDNSPSVNVTGLRSFDELTLAALNFCSAFNVRLELGSIKTDNSTVVGRLDGIDRPLLSEVSSRPDDDDPPAIFVVVARTRWFPSIHLRVNPRAVRSQPSADEATPQRRLATCTLFPTGKIVILGAKSLQDAEFTAMRAVAFIFRRRACRCWTSTRYDNLDDFECDDRCSRDPGSTCSRGCSCERLCGVSMANSSAASVETGLIATLCAGYLAATHGVPHIQDSVAELSRIMYGADFYASRRFPPLDMARRYVEAFEMDQ